MTERTPGPWEVECVLPELYTIHPETKSPDEMIANARLIAAAPDLLEAARVAEHALLRVPHAGLNSKEYAKFTIAAEKLQAAIAKAEQS